MRASEALDFARRKKIPTPRECKFMYSHLTRDELSKFRKLYPLYKYEKT